MKYDEIIKALKDLREHCNEMLEDKDSEPYSIWQTDVDALDEAMDIISDYEKVTAKLAEMTHRYEMPRTATRIAAGLYTCPQCGKRAQVGHTHCHWCGKKLSWDREAYADRDYPHMRRKGGGRK